MKKSEERVQKESDSGFIWKLANRNKGSRNNDETLIQGSDGVTFDARDKVTAVAECFEDALLSHYKQVRRGVLLFRISSFDTSI